VKGVSEQIARQQLAHMSLAQQITLSRLCKFYVRLDRPLRTNTAIALREQQRN
jgi:hypothetical protein